MAYSVSKVCFSIAYPFRFSIALAGSEDGEESEDDVQTYTTPQTDVDPSGMAETTGGATSAQEPLSKQQRV